MNYELRIKN